MDSAYSRWGTVNTANTGTVYTADGRTVYTSDRRTVITAGPRVCPEEFNCQVVMCSLFCVSIPWDDTDCSRSHCLGDGDTAETLTADSCSVCLSALPQ